MKNLFPVLPALLVLLLLAAPAAGDGFHSPLLRNENPRTWAQTMRERLGLDRSDSAEEKRPEARSFGNSAAGPLVNVLKYLQKRNVLLREFPNFNYDNIPAFKSETESLLIAMGADAVPVLLNALVTDLKGLGQPSGMARNADFIERIKHILVAIGEDAVDGIVARLGETHSRVRAMLLGLLSRIVREPDFKSSVGGWRNWHAVWSVGRRRSAASIPMLLATLDHSDHRLRLAAARSLGQIRSRLAVTALLGLLENRDRPALVKETVRALVRIGDRRAIPAFIDLLEAPHPGMREEAVTALHFLTHEVNGFSPRGAKEKRARAVARWRSWWASRNR